MTASEYKHWLRGFMRGCGVEKIEDLTKQQALIALEQAGDIIPDFYRTYWGGTFPYTVTYKGSAASDNYIADTTSAKSVFDQLSGILNKL